MSSALELECRPNAAGAARPPATRAVSAIDVAANSDPQLTFRDAFRQIFPGVMVAMFLAAADQTILASALPTIGSSLGGFEYVSWVVVAYLLAATIAAPLYGHLGDRFERLDRMASPAPHCRDPHPQAQVCG